MRKLWLRMNKNFKMGPWADKRSEKWDLKSVVPPPPPVTLSKRFPPPGLQVEEFKLQSVGNFQYMEMQIIILHWFFNELDSKPSCITKW